MKKLVTALLLMVISLSALSCTSGVQKHDVYVTVYPLKYIAEQIFFGTGYTVGIVPGVTSHENSVDWSPKEIIAMTDATYLFYVGANYDQYIDFQINSNFTNKNVELIKIENETDYIQFIQGEVHIHDEELEMTTTEEMIDDHSLGLDPHFWISPARVKDVAALLYDKIVEKFTDPYDMMEDNYNTLCANLQDLSDAYQTAIDDATKPGMTSTNIYGYLREDYGFEYFSISPGYHEETEQFTSQEKEVIVNHAIEGNIQYIIYEMYVTSPLSNAVFDELESLGMEPRKLEFNILQALTDDDIESGKDYISVMYDNLNLLKLALDIQGE
jgi:zinc transport system substrate-binding protein